MTRLILYFLPLIGSLTLLGQSPKAIQRKIANLEAKGHHVEAAQLHISLHDEGEREASIKAGMALYRIARYTDALYYFQHADSLGTLDSPDEIFGYFECLKALKKYSEADDLIQTHLANNTNAQDLKLNVDKSYFYKKIQGYNGSTIKSIPINTTYSEFGPAVLDGWLYFESSRLTDENKKLHGLNNQAYFNLYAHPIGDSLKTAVTPKGNFGKPQVMISSGSYSTLSIPEDINSTHHDGPVYLTPDGKYLFYTTNWHHEGKTNFKNPYLNLYYSYNALDNSQKIEIGKIHLNIYYSTRTDNVWSEPIPFSYNSDSWSNQHAFFDTNTNTLYFSSNRPDGMGGFDIWSSVLQGNEWSQPVNLGPSINTSRNEIFPVMSPEGYLIFASNGWPGLGGLDLFLSNDSISQPLNLLSGLNTELDDFGMTFIRKGEGYLVSNRKESVGDDDIFEFKADLDDIIDFHRPRVQITLVDAVTKQNTSGIVIVNQNEKIDTLRVGVEGLALKVLNPNITVQAIADGYDNVKFDLKDLREGSPPVSAALQPAAVPKPLTTEDLGFRIHMQENRKIIVHLDYAHFGHRKNAEQEIARLTYAVLNDYRDAQITYQIYNSLTELTQADQDRFNKRLKIAAAWLNDRGIELGKVVIKKNMDSGYIHNCLEQSRGHRDAENCLNPAKYQYQKEKGYTAPLSLPLTGSTQK